MAKWHDTQVLGIRHHEDMKLGMPNLCGFDQKHAHPAVSNLNCRHWKSNMLGA